MRQNQTSNIKHQSTQSSESPFQTKFIIAACIVAMGFCAVPLISTINKTAGFQQEYEKAKVTNQQAVENNRLIQEEYQRVNDPEYLADVARRDYYYTKSGEIIFVLPEEANQ